ncbi:MAG: hypothetical protein RLY93_13430 [Sumerlaeia bacterium]
MNRTTSLLTALGAAALLTLSTATTLEAAPRGERGRISPKIHQNDGPSADAPNRPDRPRGPEGPRGPERPHGPEGPEGPRHPHARLLLPFWENPEIVEAIELTDSQIALLEDSLEVTSDTLAVLKEEAKDLKGDLREVLEQDAPELDAVYAAVDAKAVVRVGIEKAVLGHVVVVKNVLSAEQEEALKQFLRDRERPDRPGREGRDAINDIREELRGYLEDGVLTEEEWAAIDEILAPLPEGMQDRIREGIERRLNRRDGSTPPPPRADGDGNIPPLPPLAF